MPARLEYVQGRDLQSGLSDQERTRNVTSRRPRERMEELAEDPDLIHMGHNCNHLPVGPSISKAMIDAIAAYRNDPPPYRLDVLRELIRVERCR